MMSCVLRWIVEVPTRRMGSALTGLHNRWFLFYHIHAPHHNQKYLLMDHSIPSPSILGGNSENYPLPSPHTDTQTHAHTSQRFRELITIEWILETPVRKGKIVLLTPRLSVNIVVSVMLNWNPINQNTGYDLNFSVSWYPFDFPFSKTPLNFRIMTQRNPGFFIDEIMTGFRLNGTWTRNGCHHPTQNHRGRQNPSNRVSNNFHG